MKKPVRPIIFEDFDLVKLGYNEKKKELVVKYYESGVSRDSVAITSDDNPHPDLLNSLHELSPYLARVLGLQAGYDIAREELRKSPDALKKAVDGAKNADDSVTVLNITVFGAGETKGLVIQGSLRAINGYTTVKCPVIRFNSEAMAIEKSVEAIFEKIREEAYAFLFQNKRKQLSIEEQEQNEEKRKKKLGVSKNQTEIPVE